MRGGPFFVYALKKLGGINMAALTYRFPDSDIHKQVKILATLQDKSIQDVMSELLVQYVKTTGPKYGVQFMVRG